MKVKTNSLISVKKLISKAKAQGISLGKGQPMNRLRYYIKTGLIPHMERCQADPQSSFTEGFMPDYTLDLLKKIHTLKKAKAPIAEIKKIMAKEQAKYVVSEKIPGTQLKPPEKKLEFSIPNFFAKGEPAAGWHFSLPRRLAYAAASFVFLLSTFYFLLSFTPLGSNLRSLASDYLTSLLPPPPPGEVAGEEIPKTMPIIAAGTSAAQFSENLLVDSSFEAASLGSVNKAWTFIGQSGSTNTYVTNESMRTGTLALKINEDACRASQGDTSLPADATHQALQAGEVGFDSSDGGGIGERVSTCQLGLSQPITKTINGRDYVLSVYLRAKDLIGSPKLRLGFFGIADTNDPNHSLMTTEKWQEYAEDKYQDFEPSHPRGEKLNSPLGWIPLQDWTQFSFTYKNAAKGKYPLIQIIDYQGGIVYLDDVSMVEIISSPVIASPSSAEESLQVTAGVTSGFLTQQANTRLGDGSLIADPSGNLYPRVPIFNGSLGTNANRFGSLYLINTTINRDGDFQTGGQATIQGRFEATEDVQLGESSVDELDVKARIISDLIPKDGGTYTLGEETYQWQDLYLDGTAYIDSLQVHESQTITQDLIVEGNTVLGDQASDTVSITGITYLGDGGTTNYAQFSATGDLSFYGTGDTITGPSTDLFNITNAADTTISVTGTGNDLFLTSADEIVLKPSGDTDDYFTLRTISDVPTIYGTGSYLAIGDAATASTTGGDAGALVDAEDDLLVSGNLEIAGSFLTPYAQTITVAKSGGDFTTISAALTYAATLTPSATNQILIEVKPGVYTESSGVSLISYVDLVSSGSPEATTIKRTGATVVTANNAAGVMLEGFTIDLDTADAATDYGLDITGTSSITVSRNKFTQSGTASSAIHVADTAAPVLDNNNISDASFSIGINHDGTGLVSAHYNYLRTNSNDLNVASGATLESYFDSYQQVNINATGIFRDLSHTLEYTDNTGNDLTGNVVYVNAADEVAQADGDDSTKMPAIGIVVKDLGTSVLVKTHGVYYDNAVYSNLTAGSQYYISTAAGQITTTKPTGINAVPQVIGIGKSANELYIIGLGKGVELAGGTSTYAGVVNVATSGGDYTSVQGALNDISASSSSRYLIRVFPGVYTDAVFTMEAYVDIVCVGGPEATILRDDTSSIVTGASNARLEGCTIDKTTDDSTPIINLGTSSPTLENLVITGAGTTSQLAISVSTGSPILSHLTISTINTGLKQTGAGSAELRRSSITAGSIDVDADGGTITLSYNRLLGTTTNVDVAAGATVNSQFNDLNFSASTANFNIANDATAIVTSYKDSYTTITKGANGVFNQRDYYRNDSLTALLVTQTGSGDAFRVDDVAGDTSPFVIDQYGNVGIGTTTPGATFELIGSLSHTGSTSTMDLTGAVSWDTDSSMTLGAASYALTADSSISLTASSGTITITGDGTNDINLVNTGANLDIDVATLDLSTQATFVDLASSTTALNFDGLLNLDTNNTRVGIGTTAPSDSLGVAGGVLIGSTYAGIGTTAPASGLLVEGNVGIGTTSPTAKLDVNGTLTVTGNNLTTLGGNLTASGLANLNGGIAVDTNNFTVSGTTGAVAILGAMTTGNALDIGFDSGTQTGAMVGVDVDFTNITNNNANNLYGVHINDFTAGAGAGGNLYGLYVEGTNWDYGVYIDDDVYIGGTLTGSGSGTFGYWTRSGTVVYTATDNDNVATYGNIGIGTTNPSAHLDIADASSIFTFSSSTGVKQIQTGGTTDLALMPGGNVGIGTTAPANKLTVSGNADITGNLGLGNTGPTYKLDVAGGANLSTGNDYYINGASVLNATTLGSGVVASSLTTVGALASGSIASGFGTIATANTITGTTLNATTGINTGAVAGTLRLDSAGALSNITTLSLSGAISGGTTYSGSGNITSTAGLLSIQGTGNNYFAGNVGIGTTNPSQLLAVGSASQFNVSSTGAVVAVGVDSGSGLLQGTGGLSVSGNTTLAATGGNTVGIGNSTGAITLASGGTSSWTNTAGNLTIATASSGTLALDSAGSLTVGGTSATGLTLGRAGITTVFGSTAWTATPTVSGLITATSGLTANSTVTVNSNFLQTTAVNNGFAGNLGVGTTAPLNRLDVNGAAAIGSLPSSTLPQANSLYVSGNVGIGTTNPSQLLAVGSASQFNVSSTGAVVAVGVDSGSGLLQGTGGITVTGVGNINATGTSATNIGNSTGALTLASGGTSAWTNTSGDLTLRTATSGNILFNSIGNVGIGGTAPSTAPYLFVGSNGNVGIGNTNPAVALEIGGSGNVRIGGLTASSGVYTDASKNLTSTPPTTGVLGYWSRTGTTLSPSNAGDDLVLPTGDWIGLSSSTARLVFNDTTRDNLTLTDGDLLFSADNTWDIGATGATRPRTGYFGTSLVVGSTVTISTADINFSGNSTLTLGGNLKVGTDALYVSGTSGNIGIGNTSPANKLTVSGNADITGNLGIGNTGPTYKLDVVGGANLSSGNAYYIAGTSVLNATTLGSGVVTSSLTSVGALTSGSIASGFGTIATANTITGTTLNATTGINTGAVAGTQRIDSSGNLANIGSLTLSGAISEGTTYSGSGNITSTAGVLTISGAGNSSFAGNVGIGTTSPTATLTVAGDLEGGLPILPISASGLRAYYSFNDGASTVKDFSANELNGTREGSGGANNLPQYIAGWVGQAMDFDGTDDDVTIPDTNDLFDFGTGDFTVEHWMKMTTSCSGNKVFVSRYTSTVAWNTTCTDVGGVGKTYFGVRDSNGVFISSGDGTTTINDGKWHHLAGVKIGNTVAIYVDGELDNSDSSGTFTGNFDTTVDVTIGKFGSAGYIVQAQVDETRIWSRALSADEIKTLYQLGTGASMGGLWAQSGSDIYYSSGNVGIGSTDPATTLDVVGTGRFSSTLSLADGSVGTPTLNFTDDPDTGLYRITTDKMALVTGATARLTLDATGNVGIGTTNPGSKLTVLGGNISLREDDDGNDGLTMYTSNASGAIDYKYNGTTKVTIQGNSYSYFNADNNGVAIGTDNPGTAKLAIMSGNVGIGTTGPGAKLEVNGDILLSDGSNRTISLPIHNSGNGHNLLIIAGGTTVGDGGDLLLNGGTSGGFGDPAYGDVIIANNGGNVGIGTTGPSGKLEVASGNVFFGDNANANMTQGLTINQGANDDEILALKSSDVAHGITGQTETDTYGVFKKYDAAAGGLYIRGFKDADGDQSKALTLSGVLGEVASTGKTSNNQAVVNIDAAEYSGSIQAVGANGNLLSITNHDTTMLIVDAEGTIHQIPGSDIDIDLLTIQVTGTPTLSWDESQDQFYFNKGANFNGNVGIGTTNPGSKLTVLGGNISLREDDDGNDGLTMYTSNASGAIDYKYNGTTKVTIQGNSYSYFNADNNGVAIGTDNPGTAKLAIMSGNVGIGTTGPGAKLEVSESTAANLYSYFRARGGNELIAGHMFLTKNSLGQLTGASIGSDGTGSSSGGLVLAGDTGGAGIANADMFIQYGGNVGIGTTGPGAKLEIVGTTGEGLTIDMSSNQNFLNFATTGTNKWIQYLSGDDLRFWDTTNRVTFQAGGNVGIGTTGPSYPLDIYRATGNTLVQILSADTDTNAGVIFMNDVNNWQISIRGSVSDSLVFRGGGTDRVTFQTGGNVGIGTTGPSYKLDVAGDVNITGNYRVNGTPLSSGIGGSGTANYIPKFATTTTLGNSVIYDNGNVGIGTTGPDSALEINTGASNAQLTIHSTNTQYDSILRLLGQVGDENEGLKLWYDNDVGTTYFDSLFDSASQGLRFRTRVAGTAQDAMMITNGNVGIGTTGPRTILDVATTWGVYSQGEDVAVITLGQKVSNSTNQIVTYMSGADSDYLGLKFRVHTSSDHTALPVDAMTINHLGNVGIGTTGPGANLHVYKTDQQAEDGGSVAVIEAANFDDGAAWENATLTLLGPRVGNVTSRILRANVAGSTRFEVLNTGGAYFGGNVGIGTTAPQSYARLEVNTTGSKSIYTMDSAHGGLLIGYGGSSIQGRSTSHANTDLYLNNYGGNVGIGTTGPSQKLDVAGNARIQSIGSGTYSNVVNQTSDGTLTTATSDSYFKKDIKTIDNALEKILNLRGITFNWKDENSPRRMTGMIAQEVMEVMPELVFQNPVDGYYGINYGETAGLLIEGIKEQNEILRSAQDDILGVQDDVNSSELALMKIRDDIGRLEENMEGLMVSLEEMSVGIGSEQIEGESLTVSMAEIEEAYIPKLSTETISSWWNVGMGTEASNDAVQGSRFEVLGIEKGMLVSLAEDGGAKVTDREYDPLLLGVAKSNPRFEIRSSKQILNSNDPNSKQEEEIQKVEVVFWGKAEVKIADSSSPIAVGDYLTSSKEPGKAMKATKPGYVIGKALEKWNCQMAKWSDGYEEDNNLTMKPSNHESCKDSILVFVSPGYYVGTEASDETLSDSDASTPGESEPTPGESAEEESEEATPSGEIEKALEELSERVGLLENLLAVKNDIDLFDLEAKDATISGTLQVLGKTILSELGITGKITSGLLSIDGLTNADNTDQKADNAETGASISTLSGPLKLQENMLGNLEIMGGRVVIDVKGNIKTEGEITVKKYNVDTVDPDSASAGKAILPAGETKAIIETIALTEKSLIFLTPQKAVAVGSRKIDENQFEITIKEALAEDLEIDWWIVN